MPKIRDNYVSVHPDSLLLKDGRFAGFIYISDSESPVQKYRIIAIAFSAGITGGAFPGAEDLPGNYAVFTKSGTVILNATLVDETPDAIFIMAPGSEKGILIQKSSLLTEKMADYNRNVAGVRHSKISHAARISTYGFYGTTVGPLKMLVPVAAAGYFSYDHRFIFSGVRNPLLPGLSAEIGYFSLQNVPIEISGFSGRAGPTWFIPIRFLNAQVLASMIVGRAYLYVRDAIRSGYHESFTAAALLGYEQNFGIVGIFIQSRAEYFFDPVKPLYSLGGALGVSFNFGDRP